MVEKIQSFGSFFIKMLVANKRNGWIGKEIGLIGPALTTTGTCFEVRFGIHCLRKG